MTTQTLNGTSRLLVRAVNSNWQGNANCATANADLADLFFAPDSGSMTAAQVDAAKKVCAGCPVRTACLDWAIETRQYVGVWGGLSEKERHGLYEAPEASMTRCLNAQERIEERTAAGDSQRDIARELGVDPGVLSRAIQKMRAERETLAAVGQGAVA
jgi:DNA-binding CsgD family transcriptional regulator